MTRKSNRGKKLLRSRSGRNKAKADKMTPENAVKLVIKRLKRNVYRTRRKYLQAISRRNDDVNGRQIVILWNGRIQQAEQDVRTAEGVLNALQNRAA